MKNQANHLTKKIKFNLKPGITVGLVSIPLSISLAIASGVSPIIGILAAFWGGVVAAIFAGSSYNIIGPTGALSGLILAFALTEGAIYLPVVTILVGLIVLAAWALNFHKYLIYIPGAVIHGFTLGVALTIGLGQLNNAFALKPLASHEHLLLNIVESLKVFPQMQVASALTFIIGLAFLLLIKKYFKAIPGPILLTAIGIGLGFLSTYNALPFSIPTLYSKFGALSLNLIPSKFPEFTITRAILETSLVISFIAIIETMLSAKVANVMTKTKFNERKEMLSLALANIVSGFMGGIPVTAALARTSLNIKSGADSNISAMISATMIGIISVVFFGYFQYLPMPIVAAILVNVAINMIEQEHFLFLFKHDKLSFVISIAVGIVTFAADPIIAVSVGSVIILLRQVQRMSKGDYEILVNQNQKLTGKIAGEDLAKLEEGGDPMVYSFNSELTYINREAHIMRLEQVAKNTKNLILRFRNVSYIDPDGLLMLEEILEYMKRKKVSVYIAGVSEALMNFFEHTHFLKKYNKDGIMFEKTADALKAVYEKQKTK